MALVIQQPVSVPDYTPPRNPGLKAPLAIPEHSQHAFREELPLGTQVHSCERHGESAWTVTAKIVTTLPNGKPKLYFLKCAEDAQGKAMLEGEFHSLVELYKANPDFVPNTHTWGKLCVSNPDAYYLLSDFIEMKNQAPDPASFASQVVKSHQASKSPTGIFGFHLNTCQGNLPQQTAWNPSWVRYYIQRLKGAMALNKERNGDWKDLEQLIDRLITHVVPQVLGPLEADGRKVKPTLIHGDLWDGNIGISLENGGVYSFDACSHYAHHEMEVAIWRTKSCKILGKEIYINSYLSKMGISEPVDQFEAAVAIIDATLPCMHLPAIMALFSGRVSIIAYL
ncbi:Fructosamine/Ketosamine-3-kinase [Penicillium herquei]|nr:Fructosamine/Ketosamine-3-kinase [Penicillium herquei]